MKKYANRNGYSDSIMVADTQCCALCGQRYGTKLDRHEPWGGANRAKSKALGLWVPLCHLGCHEGPGSEHDRPALNRRFRAEAQRAAMEAYGWSVGEFIRVFGKSEMDAMDAAAFPRVREDAPGGDCGFRVLDDAPLPF